MSSTGQQPALFSAAAASGPDPAPPIELLVTLDLAAAKAEHARRRQDQVQRHEIRVIPHFDALLWLAEPAWQATVSFLEGNQPRRVEAVLVPRARRWVVPRAR